MCLAEGTRITTAAGPRPIESVHAGDLVLTRLGWRRVAWSGCTGLRPTLAIETDRSTLLCTDNHPLWVVGRGWTFGADVRVGHRIPTCLNPSGDPTLSFRASGTFFKTTATTSPADHAAIGSTTETCTRRTSDRSPTIGTSTTGIRTAATMSYPTSNRSRHLSTSADTGAVEPGQSRPRFARLVAAVSGPSASRTPSSVRSAPSSSSQPDSGPSSVLDAAVVRSIKRGPISRVHDLTVEDAHEFFANGLLVHNCTWEPGSQWSPNRLDAMVWSMTELLVQGSVGVWLL
jgi:hypothetical protein